MFSGTDHRTITEVSDNLVTSGLFGGTKIAEKYETGIEFELTF